MGFCPKQLLQASKNFQILQKATTEIESSQQAKEGVVFLPTNTPLTSLLKLESAFSISPVTGT